MVYIEKLVDKFSEQGVLDSNDKEICCYGIKQGLMIILNLLFVILIGLKMDLLMESFVFSFLYICLRQYAGGYHAKSRMTCCALSLIVLIVVLLFVKNTNLYSAKVFAVLLISIFTIYIFAPVEAPDKPLDNLELNVFKFRTKVILFIELICGIILFWESNVYFECFVAAIILEAIMVIAGKIHLQRRKNRC